MPKNSLVVMIFFVLWLGILVSEGFGLADIGGRKPNIIVVVTDDQDVALQGLIPMTSVQRHLSFKGVTFMNAFTSSPMCCPSRASLLSGMYAHNHKTMNNSISGGCYGEHWREKVEQKTIATALHGNGYETFFAGKYLNGYSTAEVPRGWDHFFGLHGNSRYYNYTLTENGNLISYKDEYLTDLIGTKISEFLNERSSGTPFFALLTPPAPHAPYTAADRHKDTFEGVKAIRTPNFNKVSKILEKHWLVQMGAELPEPVLDTIDTYFRKRWQSLLAVDELVLSLIQQLEHSGEIDNTYIVYTSDNGYHMGQFAQPFDKRQPYETDIRVPFLVRGPNVPNKKVSNVPVALIDIFPTVLEWAGIEVPDDLDGVSFNTFLAKPDYKTDKNYHRQILVEHWGEGNLETYNPLCPYGRSDKLTQCTVEAGCHCQDSWNNTYSCVRHFAYKTDKIYCEFKDEENFVEAYDLHVDPYQLSNLGYEMLPSERALYLLALKNLTECSGESCRHTYF